MTFAPFNQFGKLKYMYLHPSLLPLCLNPTDYNRSLALATAAAARCPLALLRRRLALPRGSTAAAARRPLALPQRFSTSRLDGERRGAKGLLP